MEQAHLSFSLSWNIAGQRWRKRKSYSKTLKRGKTRMTLTLRRIRSCSSWWLTRSIWIDNSLRLCRKKNLRRHSSCKRAKKKGKKEKNKNDNVENKQQESSEEDPRIKLRQIIESSKKKLSELSKQVRRRRNPIWHGRYSFERCLKLQPISRQLLFKQLIP